MHNGAGDVAVVIFIVVVRQRALKIYIRRIASKDVWLPTLLELAEEEDDAEEEQQKRDEEKKKKGEKKGRRASVLLICNY